ncbi:xanthine dehydrogenase accessory protein XdhC [candidate division KSB1 bacterium]|nr:xanthine dehydrogenase accessory protein XdhC [candidate division KSB1 bacterium]
MARLRRETRAAVLVTVCRTAGSTPRECGAKMIVCADASIAGTIGGGQVEQFAIRDALNCLERRTGGIFNYPLTAAHGQCCGGGMELLMELVNCGPQLCIFGAGHVGQALSRVLEGTVFTTHLIDAREHWIRDARIPESCVRHAMGWREFNPGVAWNEDVSYAVIMTPEHFEDFEILTDLLNRPLRFVGLIGSRSKWTHFRRSLTALGFTPEAIQRVRCPVGIGRFGKAPEEIAISVAAEILADYYGTRGNPTDTAGGGEVEPCGQPQGVVAARSADVAGNSVSVLR